VGWLPVAATLSAVLGILIAWYLYLAMPGVRAGLARVLRPALAVFSAKYYFDHVYDGFVRHVVVKGSELLLWTRVDAGFIDGTVNGLGTLMRSAGALAAAGADRLRAALRAAAAGRRGRRGLLPALFRRTGAPVIPQLPHLLSLSDPAPLAGALVSRSRGASPCRSQKLVGLGVTLATFVVSLGLVKGFNDVASYQFEERVSWIPGLGDQLPRRIDGLSLWLVILTTFLTPLCLLGSWTQIESRVREFVLFMLLLEAGMIGVFVALDLFLFYVFWEAMLIPMYFLIGIWGHDRRIYAAVKFFLYTFAGSVLMLVAFLVLYANTGSWTFDIPSSSRRRSTRRCRRGCSWPARSPSRSRCRCGRSTPGCPTRTSRRPRPAR
jgi:NADH:ubiquinone oxidoreductase subunit 5 (subunit L)/multisubunit Na+/H+ antiporter MnhA subunit